MGLVRPLKEDPGEGYEEPFDTSQDLLSVEGIALQANGSNDAKVTLTRDNSDNLVLKDPVSSRSLASLVAAATGISRTEFLLSSSPVHVSNSYTSTSTGSQLTHEEWRDVIVGHRIKTSDYAYSGRQLSTETHRVYDTDGTTVIGQVTITYTYAGNKVSNILTTRDI